MACAGVELDTRTPSASGARTNRRGRLFGGQAGVAGMAPAYLSHPPLDRAKRRPLGARGMTALCEAHRTSAVRDGGDRHRHRPRQRAARLHRRAAAAASALCRLMRLDRPIGSWLLYWPCAWSVALAGVGGRWDLFLWLALGAFAMRSAGCVYNDIVDRDLDRQVERTRLRPLASGRVSLRSAWLLIGAAVPDRADRASPAQMGRGADRARQPRAGRRLSVHEADHLVAAGVARARLLVGRAGRLAGGDRQPRACRRCCCGSGASPG